MSAPGAAGCGKAAPGAGALSGSTAGLPGDPGAPAGVERAWKRAALSTRGAAGDSGGPGDFARAPGLRDTLRFMRTGPMTERDGLVVAGDMLPELAEQLTIGTDGDFNGEE